MIRENGRNENNMIRKACTGAVASIFLALTFATGCNSTSAIPPVTPITTVSTQTPAGQNAVISTKYGSPLMALVTTGPSGSPGTPVAGVTVTFTAPNTSGATGFFGSATGNNYATATTNSSGIATSPSVYANSIVGTYTVAASVASTQSVAIFSLFNTGQPVPLAVAGGSPQSTSISTTFNSQLSVTVKDGSGTSVGQGLPVTFTNASSNGTFADSQTNTTTAITNSSGVATAAPFIAGATATGAGGQYTITASTIDGDANTTSFTLSNTIVPAAITAAGSSTPQTAAVNTPFAPLTVTVVDATTPTPLPVGGALITFSAPSFTVNSSGVDSTSSGTFPGNSSSVNVWTDANGVATAPTFTANGLAGGPYNVSATVVVKSGSTLSVNFALTNQ